MWRWTQTPTDTDRQAAIALAQGSWRSSSPQAHDEGQLHTIFMHERVEEILEL